MIVNIIGNGFGKDDAPHEGIRWGANNVIFKRDVSVMFDMHDHLHLTGERINKCSLIAKECRSKNVPTFSVNADDFYMKYPIEKIVKHFNTQFFSNGICYMIALALYQGATKIRLWGVNHNHHANPSEHRDQKAGVDFWVGRAGGMGVDVEINGILSEVGKTPTGFMYGYEQIKLQL